MRVRLKGCKYGCLGKPHLKLARALLGQNRVPKGARAIKEAQFVVHAALANEARILRWCRHQFLIFAVFLAY